MSDPDIEWLRSLASVGIGYGRSDTKAKVRAKRLIARLEAAEKLRDAAAGMPCKWTQKMIDACSAYDATVPK